MAVLIHSEFGMIRAIAIEGDAWLAGVDVAKALGYQHPEAALMQYVEEEEQKVIQRGDGTPFAVPCDGLTLINECGVEALICCSDHPKAKKFQHWFTRTVLPSLCPNAFIPLVERLVARVISDERPAAKEPESNIERVNHPQHYNTSVECIDLIEETQGAEAMRGFCIGNALKYLYRHRQKNGIEDIKKAVWYLQRYIKSAENQ